MDQENKSLNLNSSDSFTYVVKQNKYTVTKDHEVKQVGGDWYNIFTSIGSVRVNGDLINELVKKGFNCHQIEAEGKKINETFTLSGALILKRGTPFANNVVFSKDDVNLAVYDEGDYDLYNELQSVANRINEQAAIIAEAQEKLNEAIQKTLTKTKKRKLRDN